MQPHVVVWNNQREQLTFHTTDGQHTIVVEQADEIVIVHNTLSGEMTDEKPLDISLFRDLVDDAEAVLLHVVDFYEPLELAVVRHRIGIDHNLRAFARINELTHVVANHVAVEHTWFHTEAVIGEAVVVVPRLHVSDDVVLSLVVTDSSHLFIIADHLSDLRLREAQHLVEASVEAHVQRDVVATRKVVKRDRRHAEHDDTVKHRLEEFEDVAVEASAVSEFMISLLPFHVEHVVGEIVVLVDDEIELVSCLLCLHPDYVELAGSSFFAMHPLDDARTIVVLIVINERVHHIAAVAIEVFV